MGKPVGHPQPYTRGLHVPWPPTPLGFRQKMRQQLHRERYHAGAGGHGEHTWIESHCSGDRFVRRGVAHPEELG